MVFYDSENAHHVQRLPIVWEALVQKAKELRLTNYRAHLENMGKQIPRPYHQCSVAADQISTDSLQGVFDFNGQAYKRFVETLKVWDADVSVTREITDTSVDRTNSIRMVSSPLVNKASGRNSGRNRSYDRAAPSIRYSNRSQQWKWAVQALATICSVWDYSEASHCDGIYGGHLQSLVTSLCTVVNQTTGCD